MTIDTFIYEPYFRWQDRGTGGQGNKIFTYATWIKYDAWLGDNVRLVFKELSGATADQSVGGTGGPFPHGIANPDAFTDK